jgi:isoquinoline 1-oxidoreductase beta subunit
MPITDLHDLCTGRGVFGIDAEMPGMVFASVERAPVYGSQMVRYDDTETLNVPGVLRTVVIQPFAPPHAFQALGGVAVIAENTWAAIKGRRALRVTWSDSPHTAYDSESFKAKLKETVSQPQKVLREIGDFDKVYAASPQKHEAAYYAPHLAHAPMEPPMAVASFKEGKVVTHAPTQNPQAVQQAVAGALGIQPEDVACHVTLIGGGFGRKSKPDFVVEASLLSRELDRPVKIVWTREDDLQFDYFHTVSAMALKAGLDADGKAQALLYRSAFPTISSTFAEGAQLGAEFEVSMGLNDVPFHVRHHRAENGPAENHVRIGWLRSVCNVFHAFALHSFIDELAHLAQRDPLEYLLESLGPDRKVDLAAEGVKYANHGQPLDRYPLDIARLRHVIEKVAESSGWKSAEKQAGRGMGIAAHRSFLAYVACVATVEVDDEGAIRIPRMDVAIDAGKLINPDRVHSQMEGGAVFGASLALYGEITAKAGRIQQTNFDGYRLTRMAEAPREIQVHLVESDELPAGVGEPGVPPIAPAIANAYFAATGKRVRDLPLVKA